MGNEKPTSLFLNDLASILNKFSPVSLSEIDQVKLMSRIDRKYWFHRRQLPEILNWALHNYDILEIEGQRIMGYRTTYFDTPDNTMYISHQNRKLNRHKIRQRKYMATDSSFLEVKFKTNKKETVKTRIPTCFEKLVFSDTEVDFVVDGTPFNSDDLKPSLNNRFERLTLVSKDKTERCTIDISPVFWNEKGEVEVSDLVIFELKRAKGLNASPIVSVLREKKIRQRGLSKYCTGRALLDPTLKQNNFKPRLRFIDRHITF